MEQIIKTVRAGKIRPGVEDQFYVEEDIPIPEVKSDASGIICSGGRIHVDELRPADHYVRVSGRYEYQILYVTDMGSPQLSSVSGSIPFEEMVYMEEEARERLFVKSISAEPSASLIHARKISLRVSVELEIGEEWISEENVTEDMEEEGALYRKYGEKEILEMQGVHKDIYRIKEELQLPSSHESIGSVLFTDTALRKFETRLEQDSLILRGELLVFCLYESENMKPEWLEQSVPFEGRLPFDGAKEEMYHCVYASLADSAVESRMDEDGQMRLIGVDASVEIRCSIYMEEKIKILEDLYAPDRKLIPSREKLELEALVMQNNSRYRLTEQLSLPEIREGTLQICHSSGYLQLETVKVQEGEVLAEGVLNVSFLYLKEDDGQPFALWQGMVPFSHRMECAGASAAMRCDTSCTLEQLSVSLMGNGETEVKASISFQVFLRKNVEIDNIVQVEEQPADREELENAPGIVGYIVKEKDTLWDLARRYHTTEEGIMASNDLKDGQIKAGDRLLIFKENMGIL